MNDNYGTTVKKYIHGTGTQKKASQSAKEEVHCLL
jgi:hypothetical protein